MKTFSLFRLCRTSFFFWDRILQQFFFVWPCCFGFFCLLHGVHAQCVCHYCQAFYQTSFAVPFRAVPEFQFFFLNFYQVLSYAFWTCFPNRQICYKNENSPTREYYYIVQTWPIVYTDWTYTQNIMTKPRKIVCKIFSYKEKKKVKNKTQKN